MSAMRSVGIKPKNTQYVVRVPGGTKNADASSFTGDQVSHLMNDLRQGGNSKILCSLNLDDEKAGEVSDMWLCAADLFDLLLDTATPNTAANRVTKSEKVRVAAARYVATYERVINVPKSQNYPNYLHEIKFHFHQYILYVSTNLSELSGQALEHLNKMAKQAGKCTNYKSAGALVGPHRTPQAQGALAQAEARLLALTSMMHIAPARRTRRAGLLAQLQDPN